MEKVHENKDVKRARNIWQLVWQETEDIGDNLEALEGKKRLSLPRNGTYDAFKMGCFVCKRKKQVCKSKNDFLLFLQTNSSNIKVSL